MNPQSQKQLARSLHFGVALKLVYRFLHKMVRGSKTSKREKYTILTRHTKKGLHKWRNKVTRQRKESSRKQLAPH